MLFAKADQDNYRIYPDRKVELLEDTRTALHRELIEETGRKPQVKDCLWITKNDFNLDETDYHEPAFICALSPTDPAILDYI